MGTELISSGYSDLDSWPAGRILRAIIDSNSHALEAVAKALPQLEAAAELLRERLAAGGRLVYAGAGTSGRLALQDAAELPPTFGFSATVVLMAGGAEAGSAALEGAEDDAEGAAAAVREARVGPADALIGVAASGRTPWTVTAVREARLAGAATVGIANNAGSPLLQSAEVEVLLETGPEVLAGSTRLAAGTAQKVALNALSTTVLVQLGGAYGNLMVGMQPTNDKLRERAHVIVAEATGAAREEVGAALAAADWEIKTAIVSLLGGAGVAEARAALAAAGGVVRQALGQLRD